MQQYFIGRDPADAAQQALAQQERYVQQANLIAGRADQQMAQDNAFAFQARNQLANEEAQRYQFATAADARVQDAARQDRNFFANQALSKSQEARLDAQGRRDEEKLRFDINRVQRDEKQRVDNSEFLTDAFAKSVGYTQSELDKTEAALRAAKPKVDDVLGRARAHNLTLDKSGQFVFQGNMQPFGQQAVEAQKFMSETAPVLSEYKQLAELRNLWETKRHELEAQGMKDRLFVAGNKDTGIEVFDGFTGVRKQAMPAPAARQGADATQRVIDNIRSLPPRMQQLALQRALAEGKITPQQMTDIWAGR